MLGMGLPVALHRKVTVSVSLMILLDGVDVNLAGTVG